MALSFRKIITMFAVKNVRMYHPEKEMASQGNFIMVSIEQLIFALEELRNILIITVPLKQL